MFVVIIKIPSTIVGIASLGSYDYSRNVENLSILLFYEISAAQQFI